MSKTTSVALPTSFLRDAFETHAGFTSDTKQQAEQKALKWLQSQIEADTLAEFAQKWRGGDAEAAKSPIHLENLAGSYKGSNSVNGHQETALTYIQEKVPPEVQEQFKARWTPPSKFKVSNTSGTLLMAEEKDASTLATTEPDGEGKTWLSLERGDVCYLLSHEEKGDYYLVSLTENIGPDQRSTWFVPKDDVAVSEF